MKKKVYGDDSNGCLSTLQVLADLCKKVRWFDKA